MYICSEMLIKTIFFDLLWPPANQEQSGSFPFTSGPEVNNDSFNKNGKKKKGNPGTKLLQTLVITSFIYKKNRGRKKQNSENITTTEKRRVTVLHVVKASLSI